MTDLIRVHDLKPTRRPGHSKLHGRPLDEDGAIEFTRQDTAEGPHEIPSSPDGAELREAKARVLRLLGHLQKYGTHNATCAAAGGQSGIHWRSDDYGVCDCGLGWYVKTESAAVQGATP